MLWDMNRLPLAKRVQIIGMLVEGNSLRSCSRLADVSINTVTKLLVDVGAACAKFHDENVRNVRVRRLQCDEIWCFVGAKAKNVTPEQKAEGWGDAWTWTGLDADTKLCVSYLVGGRDAGWAKEFMDDCASRIKGRVRVTTDGHRAYQFNSFKSNTLASLGGGGTHHQLMDFWLSSLEVRGKKRRVALRCRHENLGHGQHSIKRIGEGKRKLGSQEIDIQLKITRAVDAIDDE